MSRPVHGMLHHVELWVPDLPRVLASLGWLPKALVYAVFQCWDGGRSWFHVEDAATVERLVADAVRHGRRLMVVPERSGDPAIPR
ncbi:hypothetical protein [Streptomyces sp. NPDC002779]|uniref:hypothetical protein n=1 Tax=Streptomyces sp. NPDC002779 TaxID=3364664 RepID=UPI0036B4656E